jgi:hypothetical protein
LLAKEHQGFRGGIIELAGLDTAKIAFRLLFTSGESSGFAIFNTSITFIFSSLL